MAKTSSNYWNVSEITVTYTNESSIGQVTTELNPKFFPPTPIGFSYHCYKPDPVGRHSLTSPDVSVKFVNLQVSAISCGLHGDF